MKHFEVSVERDVTIVHFLDGCIDQSVFGKPEDPESFCSECGRLPQMLNAKKILLDFAGVRFFGSAVLGALVKLHQTLKAASGRLVLCHVDSDVLMEKLQRTHLDKLFTIIGTQEEALGCM